MKLEKWIRKIKAEKHHQCMWERFSREIKTASVEYYDKNYIYQSHGALYIPEIVLVQSNTVDQIFFNRDKLTTVLDFASFEHIGGGYMNGAMAQEESLCASSNLYEILSYKAGNIYSNREITTNSLYTDEMLLCRNVIFHKEGTFNNIGKKAYVDVICCAAPNGKAARRKGVSEAEIYDTLEKRIEKVLGLHNTEVFILGAWGCGVFGLDPGIVASTFLRVLRAKPYHFKKAIFAIPDQKNFDMFDRVFEEDSNGRD